MTDLHNGLGEVHLICQLTRDARFRAYEPAIYLGIWVATAAAALTLISIGTVTGAGKVDSALAMEMILATLAQFLPAIVTGFILTLLLLHFAPQSLWMLPGLWRVLFSTGVFAWCQYLPRPMSAVEAGILAMGDGRAYWYRPAAGRLQLTIRVPGR